MSALCAKRAVCRAAVRGRRFSLRVPLGLDGAEDAAGNRQFGGEGTKLGRFVAVAADANAAGAEFLRIGRVVGASRFGEVIHSA